MGEESRGGEQAPPKNKSLVSILTEPIQPAERELTRQGAPAAHAAHSAHAHSAHCSHSAPSAHAHRHGHPMATNIKAEVIDKVLAISFTVIVCVGAYVVSVLISLCNLAPKPESSIQN